MNQQQRILTWTAAIASVIMLLFSLYAFTRIHDSLITLYALGFAIILACCAYLIYINFYHGLIAINILLSIHFAFTAYRVWRIRA